MKDLGTREKLILIPVMALMLWIGVYSGPVLRRMDASIQLVQQRIDKARNPAGGFRVERLEAPVQTERMR
jgi:NADH:ubiquinone oxidoreductase subunit 4 (subunit M)